MLGTHNPMVKAIRKAVQRGARTGDGFAVAEGFHLLEEARRAGAAIGAIVATRQAAERISGGEPLHLLEDSVFAQISSVEASQGVVSLVRMEPSPVERCLLGNALVVALDGVQDPGNAGAILRAAEAFGATGAVFLPGSVSPWNPKALRASAGSVFRLPVAMCEWESLAGLTQDRDIALYAADARAAKAVQEVPLAQPSVILIGNEGQGIPAAHRAAATPVRIPTVGVESLNAAVAAGILLYEARRQRS